jgi:hypothetical protein
VDRQLIEGRAGLLEPGRTHNTNVATPTDNTDDER